MTGKTARIRKYIVFFFKFVFFWKNNNFVDNILGKKVDLFLAILTLLMAALDAQQNFMPTYILFFSYLYYIKSYIVLCETFANVELMAPLDAPLGGQQNFMLMKYNFFLFLSLLDEKL